MWRRASRSPTAGKSRRLRAAAGRSAIQLRVLIQAGTTIEEYVEPKGVRVDSGVAAGPVVAGYDPMVLKLIARGDSWDACYAQAKDALAHLVLKGVTWNQALLAEILNHPAFMQNKLFTRFLSDLDAEKRAAEKRAAAAGGPVSVTVPFPGEVHEVSVKPGDSVKAGDVVLIFARTGIFSQIFFLLVRGHPTSTQEARRWDTDRFLMFHFGV